MREDEQIKLKSLAPLPLRETCRLMPLLVITISLDSPIKLYEKILGFIKGGRKEKQNFSEIEKKNLQITLSV
jgi:hypothetical protein